MVVYSPSETGFRQVANEIAEVRGDDVVTDVSALEGTDDPVIYVDSPGEITEAVLLNLQQRLDRKGPETGAFGIITGYTPAKARDLYFSESDYGDEHGLLIWYTPDEFETEEMTKFSWDGLTADALESLNERGLKSLSIETHGWPIHMHLKEGYVCGVPAEQDVEDFSGTQPRCVQGDEVNCPFDEKLLPADTLDASHVFVRTCSSMINNNFADMPVHVGMGLLDGATSLIGPYRNTFGYAHEPRLHYSLLRAGYTAAERCYLLNRDADVNNTDTFPYVTFGRPYVTIDDPSTGEYETTIDGRSVTVEAARTHVVDIELDRSDFPAETERYYVRSDGEIPTANSLRYLAFEEGEAVRLILYTGERMDVSGLRLEVSPHRIDHEERAIAFDAHRNAQSLRNLDVLPSKAVKQLDDLWHRTRDLSEDTYEERLFVSPGQKVSDRIDDQFNYVDAIEKQLLSVLSGGERFREQYSNRATDTDAYPSAEPCAYCGRQVFVKHVSDGDETERALGTCPRCGEIFDVPIDGRTPSPPYPEILIDGSESSDETSFCVSFENSTDVPVDATFYPTILDFGSTTDDGEQIFAPSVAERRIDPGEEVRPEFAVQRDVLDPNQHYVVAFVVGNLEVYAGTTPYIVGGRPGRQHRRYQ